MWFLSRPQWREVMSTVLPILLFVLAVFAIAYQFVEPAPPRRITMTTGSEQGAYHAFGKKYAAALAKAGIALELKPSAGTIENLARLNVVKTGVQVGLAQGGIANAQNNPDLSSLGRIGLEPLWVFHRAVLKLDLISGLAGKKIAVGMEGSGTRPLATGILAASGVTAQNATFLGSGAKDSADKLIAGEADAVFLAMSVESEVVQRLLRHPDVKLLTFTQADALARLYPYLSKVVLPAGVVDMAANLPAQDVNLVAPAASLLVCQDLHPALVRLLVEAAKDVHGKAGLFQKPGEFPQAVDTEIPMDADATRYYKNGPPLLERYLPFWLATFLERMMVMVIPIATVLLPLIKVVPMAYQWRIKRRILFWYDKLKKLERQVRADKTLSKLGSYRDEIHRIEDAVSAIPIPLAYSDQLYTLRSAVDLVRQRIAAIAETEGSFKWQDESNRETRR